MTEMDYDHPPVQFQTIFESAKGFGLSDQEIWRVFNESQYWAGPDATVPEYLDELSGALAHRIVIKERRTREAQHMPSGRSSAH
jgi:hypothetical protein